MLWALKPTTASRDRRRDRRTARTRRRTPKEMVNEPDRLSTRAGAETTKERRPQRNRLRRSVYACGPREGEKNVLGVTAVSGFAHTAQIFLRAPPDASFASNLRTA
ncbi:hypothetical protein EVAR_66913_1 [Eumeta japonica]|uniref:Uncharacterized protein n=1 Tax=Eumeta variegata TaxID=151549 RepID=A0A4C1Z969_EUMVA|nr:hypothetical protein EVAR_66913_1 [Eumeta japonica]